MLVSKMYQTATDIVNNLIYLVEEFGFVLTGSRAYYTNRRYHFLSLTLIVSAIQILKRDYLYYTLVILN